MWPLNESQCKWWNTIFSVCMKLLLLASGNPSLSDSSQSILGFVRENLSAVFAHGFHMESIIPSLHSCSGYGGDAFQSCWGQKWPNFCRYSLPTPDMLGLLVRTLELAVSVSWPPKSSVPCVSHSHETFVKQVFFFFLKFYLIVYCSTLVPYFGKSPDRFGWLTPC